MDRNSTKLVNFRAYITSLSARRAWIEIIGLTYDGLIASVALRKESVDRNLYLSSFALALACRSPQGERG